MRAPRNNGRIRYFAALSCMEISITDLHRNLHYLDRQAVSQAQVTPSQLGIGPGFITRQVARSFDQIGLDFFAIEERIISADDSPFHHEGCRSRHKRRGKGGSGESTVASAAFGGLDVYAGRCQIRFDFLKAAGEAAARPFQPAGGSVQWQ